MRSLEIFVRCNYSQLLEAVALCSVHALYVHLDTTRPVGWNLRRRSLSCRWWGCDSIDAEHNTSALYARKHDSQSFKKSSEGVRIWFKPMKESTLSKWFRRHISAVITPSEGPLCFPSISRWTTNMLLTRSVRQNVKEFVWKPRRVLSVDLHPCSFSFSIKLSTTSSNSNHANPIS